MSTPTSASTSYVTASASLAYVDKRLVGQLVGDNGSEDLSPATNANWQAALDAAAGEVESACLMGGRYTPADLATLIGVSQKLLWRIIARLALGDLLGGRRQPLMQTPESVKDARDFLERLRKGERIFGLVELQDAAQPILIDDTASTTRPLPTALAARVFGRRAKYYRPPFGSQGW